MMYGNFYQKLKKNPLNNVWYSESQIFEYIARIKFFDNSKETSFYFQFKVN